MTVLVGDVTFADWVSLKYEGGYTDTFIFDVDALNGLPPFGYRPLLQRLAAELNRKRPGASLWIRVESPGEWYRAEVKRSLLRGLALPYVVPDADQTPDYQSFSGRPCLFPPSVKRPPAVEAGYSHVSRETLKCLQVLNRIRKGAEAEIASLTGLSEAVTRDALCMLENQRLVKHETGRKIQQDRSRPVEMDPFPLWHPTRSGSSIALRSWGAPRRVKFSNIKESNPGKICTFHRNTSRRWLAWLRSAYPCTEIWTGWSETHLPGISFYPDALAWGRIQGYETLFWLEVGDEHKSRDEIAEVTRKRLGSAWRFCQETGVRLVYAQISPPWVQDTVRGQCSQLPPEVSVILAHRRGFGKLPVVEWGMVTSL